MTNKYDDINNDLSVKVHQAKNKMFYSVILPMNENMVQKVKKTLLITSSYKNNIAKVVDTSRFL